MIAIRMRVLGVASAFVSVACAEGTPTYYAKEQVESFMRCVIENEKEGVRRPPIKLAPRDVYKMRIVMGDPKVKWLGNDSMLRIELQVKSEAFDRWAYLFQITVEPPITRAEESAPVIDWTEILSTRRITQYHILESRFKGGEAQRKTLKLLTKERNREKAEP